MNQDQSCVSYQLHNHNHTLGNPVRYMLMKHPEIEFAAYSMPHPSEEVINLRIQTTGRPASEILSESLKNLIQVTKCIAKEFDSALEKFENQK